MFLFPWRPFLKQNGDRTSGRNAVFKISRERTSKNKPIPKISHVLDDLHVSCWNSNKFSERNSEHFSNTSAPYIFAPQENCSKWIPVGFFLVNLHKIPLPTVPNLEQHQKLPDFAYFFQNSTGLRSIFPKENGFPIYWNFV